MILSDEFIYKRKYFIKDIPRPSVIFNKCSQLEFDTFDSFIRNYLLKESMITQTHFNKIIIPISEVGQISLLKNIENNIPVFIFYLKIINKEVLSEITSNNLLTNKFGILIDSDKIHSFKETLESLDKEIKEKVCEKLSVTHGAFRHILTKENAGNLITDATLPYYTFPFFNFCDLIINYHEFEDMKLKDLHELIYQFKFIYKNFISNTKNKSLNWTYYNPNLREIEYSFKFMERDGSELYISENNIRIYPESTELPEFQMELINSDGNYMSQKFLDRFLGALSLEYDCKMFVSKYENYLCNGNLTSLPYLNRIINNVIMKGDI